MLNLAWMSGRVTSWTSLCFLLLSRANSTGLGDRWLVLLFLFGTVDLQLLDFRLDFRF